MAETVQKMCLVLGAEYNHDSRCIVLAVECDKGRFMTQVPLKAILPNITNLESFSKDQMRKVTKLFCEKIIGQNRMVVFDPDLENKIKDKKHA